MACSHVSSSSNFTPNPRTSVEVVAPAGIQDGDIIVFAGHTLRTSGSPDEFGLPSGFTQWASAVFSYDYDTRLAMGWKRASSESGNYTFTTTNSSYTYIALVVIRGCIQTGDPADVAISNTAYTTTNTVLRAAGISPTHDGMLVWAGASRVGSNSLSVPSGMTERANGGSSSSSKMAMADLVISAGATGNKDGTTVSTNGKHAMMVALREHGAAGGLSIPLLNHLLLGD